MSLLQYVLKPWGRVAFREWWNQCAKETGFSLKAFLFSSSLAIYVRRLTIYSRRVWQSGGSHSNVDS
jgi:hypothetical protein